MSAGLRRAPEKGGTMRPSVRSTSLAALVTAVLPLVLGCVPPPSVKITSPPHGMFVSAGATGVQITGAIADIDPADASVTVNGVAAQIDAATRTFHVLVPFGPERLFEPLLAELTQVSSGKHFRDRIVVIRDLEIGEATPVANAVALRIRQSALDDLAPVVTAVLEEQLDITALLPQEPVESDGVTVTILDDPPASLGGITLAFDTVSNAVDVTTVLDDISIAARIDKPTIPRLHCELGVSIGSLTVKTREQLEPGGSDGETIAVQQIKASTASEVVVTASGLASTADCSVGPGLFDDAKEKKMRELIQANLVGAIAGFLADPDGADEPLPAPIAAALETQLAGLDLGGVEVPLLRSKIEAGFNAIFEQEAFIDASLDVDVDLKRLETGLSRASLATTQAIVKPDPNLTGSLRVNGVYPALNSSVKHDIGMGLSFSGLNRLLMSETEARRFQKTIDAVDGPNGPEPFTAADLAVIPEFAALPPETPLRARLKATLAPVLTGKAGPHGELLEVQVAQVAVTVVKLVTSEQGQVSEKELLKLAIDARAGVNVSIQDGGLAAALGTLEPADLTITVLSNPIGANEALLEVFGPIVLSGELPEIVGTATSFPLPSFLDLAMQGKQILRKDGYLLLFASLVPAP